MTKAGGLFVRQGAYTDAARVLADALRLRGGPADAEPDLVDPLIESLFLGAESPDMWEVIDSLRESYPGWDLLTPVAARSMLVREEIDQARRLTVQFLASHPDDPLANAVLAELRLKTGNLDDARQVAERTLGMPRTPEWLRPFLERLIEATRNPS
jgi:hypothetical protein